MSFPKSEQRSAWEVFAAIVVCDPIIRREIKTLIAVGGGPKQRETPSSGDLPYLRLTPSESKGGGNQGVWIDNEEIKSDIEIDVYLALPGTDIGDMMDAWDALIRAVYPKDQALYEAIDQRLAGTATGNVSFETPAVEWDKDGLPLVATGKIRLERCEKLKYLS